MLEDIKELFQTFIAPQLEGIRGDIRALDAKIGAVDTKVESFRRELLAEIHRVEQVLSTDFVRMEQTVDLRLAAMDQKFDSRLTSMDGKLDSFRREMLAEIRAVSK